MSEYDGFTGVEAAAAILRAAGDAITAAPTWVTGHHLHEDADALEPGDEHDERIAAAILDAARDVLGVRRVLDLHRPTKFGKQIGCASCVEPDEEPTPWPCPTARALGVTTN